MIASGDGSRCAALLLLTTLLVIGSTAPVAALGVGDKAPDFALPVAGEAVPLRLRWKEARRALRLHRGLHPDLNPRGRGSPARSSQVREPERPGRGHQHGLPAAS